MKRPPGLRDLSDDHHTALIVAVRCKRATAANHAAIWVEVRAGAVGHFDAHFALEEAHLLPALDALGESSASERIRAEHGELRAALAEASPELGEVVAFGRLLERHVRFEEREVFEPFQSRLPASVLEALSEAPPRRLDVSRLNALR